MGSNSNDSVVQSDTALLGIRITYSLISFTLWILAILMLRKYGLSDRCFNEIKNNIHERSEGV